MRCPSRCQWLKYNLQVGVCQPAQDAHAGVDTSSSDVEPRVPTHHPKPQPASAGTRLVAGCRATIAPQYRSGRFTLNTSGAPCCQSLPPHHGCIFLVVERHKLGSGTVHALNPGPHCKHCQQWQPRTLGRLYILDCPPPMAPTCSGAAAQGRLPASPSASAPGTAGSRCPTAPGTGPWG